MKQAVSPRGDGFSGCHRLRSRRSTAAREGYGIFLIPAVGHEDTVGAVRADPDDDMPLSALELGQEAPIDRATGRIEPGNEDIPQTPPVPGIEKSLKR